jgi:hypothetical protein
MRNHVSPIRDRAALADSKMQVRSREDIFIIKEVEDMYIDLANRIEEISNDIQKISKYISRL